MANNNLNWSGNNVVDNNHPQMPPNGQFCQASRLQGLKHGDNMQVQNQPVPSKPETIPETVPEIREGPPPITNTYYIPGYLATLIGKTVRAEFIINNSYLDKVGVLEEVGVNYFVLHDTTMRNYIMCDLYSVKFITILD